MARKPNPLASASRQPTILSTPAGTGEIVEVVRVNEHWSEYELADGSILRVRPVVVEVVRDNTQSTPDGEPLYHMKASLIPNMRVNPILVKKKS